MTKQLELRRISDEEIRNIADNIHASMIGNRKFPTDLGKLILDRTLDIQLQSDQQILDNVKQAIFDEIEKKLYDRLAISLDDEMLWWQALKKKWLK